MPGLEGSRSITRRVFRLCIHWRREFRRRKASLPLKISRDGKSVEKYHEGRAYYDEVGYFAS